MLSFDEFIKQDDAEKYNNMQKDLLEIERLKKRLEESQLAFLQVDKDKRRLNNIINELEKYSENMIVNYYEAIEEAVDNIDRFNLLGARSSYCEIVNKIKELKGVDKE